uniref:Uncharacterized protein n=1 Tax=Desertifilum tharense IPPAS B-1220 TaxID=1781255 RepID=A0ACD5GRH7_9CYAN
MDLLYTTFPKALQETLKEDFAKDGQAFAGLTLQLLTGMKAEIAQLRNANIGSQNAEFTQILERFQQIETRLNGTEAQQKEVFEQISQQINSEFFERCQQLGVLQTNITQLLESLEESVKDVQEKVTDIYKSLIPQPLTEEEWQEICRQNLAQQKELTTNLFTNAYGVTPNLITFIFP